MNAGLNGVDLKIVIYCFITEYWNAMIYNDKYLDLTPFKAVDVEWLTHVRDISSTCLLSNSEFTETLEMYQRSIYMIFLTLVNQGTLCCQRKQQIIWGKKRVKHVIIAHFSVKKKKKKKRE